MSEGLKEPRKVLYEDKDVVSAVSYSLSENQDKESENVGDTTDMMDRTENGWCIVTGVCIVYFFYMLHSLNVHCGSASFKFQEPNMRAKKEIDNSSREKYHLCPVKRYQFYIYRLSLGLKAKMRRQNAFFSTI